MFDTVLIANRGEIACRVMRTCRRMGIRTIAVYSQADAPSRHVALADRAYPIGPSPARDSYLRIDRIVDAARLSGAQAIHPGYGFLSENAEFAEACAQAGIVFIGPPADAMRAMGSKAAAKTLMQQAGVPLVPGYHGVAQDIDTLAGAAAAIGYPVLIKASAGGGGKGMRVVEHAGDLAEAIGGAQREAASAFGDDRLLIEKYLTRPRHIEIQVFADMHGNCVHLFERDCSIQRRHQKVIEEAPAPHMTQDRRGSMGQAAIAAARAVGYVGAGTVEFIAEHDAFYFMEMNTRLQVEHPVTEMITGQELVEWQLRVAAGERLPCTQEQLAVHGHAIEARLYAEDPALEFRPSIGRITHLRPPRRAAHVRIDSGVRAGDSITPFYDPMIAKLIVWGEDRAAAVTRLQSALAEYQIAGVQTNLGLLRAIAAAPDFVDARIDTGFIARHPALLAKDEAGEDETALLAAVWIARAAQFVTPAPSDQGSPWIAEDGWRLNLPGADLVLLQDGDHTHRIVCTPHADGSVTIPLGETSRHVAAGMRRDGVLRLSVDGVVQTLTVLRDGSRITILRGGTARVFHRRDPLAPPATLATTVQTDLRAPMPARVVRIAAQAGAAVHAGDILMVIEAMKMEMSLPAASDGVIAAVHAAVGDMVGEGVLLISFAASEA